MGVEHAGPALCLKTRRWSKGERRCLCVPVAPVPPRWARVNFLKQYVPSLRHYSTTHDGAPVERCRMVVAGMWSLMDVMTKDVADADNADLLSSCLL